MRPEGSRLKNQETAFYDVGYLETLDATPSDLLVTTISDPRETRQLVACDPSGLQTLAIGLKAGQKRLALGTLVTLDGERALTPGQAVGVLAHSIDTDVWEDGDVITVYTGGKFLWKAVFEANPGMVFDPLTISGLRARGLGFEAVYSGGPSQWISLP